MKPKIEIEGVAEFHALLKKELKNDKAGMNKALAKAAIETHSTAVKSIQTGSRTGKIYQRKTITHQASAPGEPPKTDTGALVRNVTLEKEKKGYTVGSRKGAPHGFWLEFGTSKVKARPWLQPAFDKIVAKFKGTEK